MTQSTSAIEQAVRARIQAAKRRTEDMRRQRAELAAARRAGKARAHAAKLRRLAEQDGDRNSTPVATGLPDRVGAHVIVPIPWCSCGGALGIAPGRVTGFERDGSPVVQLDLSGCSTRPAPPHCTAPPLVFTRREIEDLRWLL